MFSSMLMRKLSVGRVDMPVDKFMPKELTEKDEVALDRDLFKKVCHKITSEYYGK